MIDRTSPADSRSVLIRPTRGWAGLGLGSAWEYRELLYFLTWRDLKVRYRQTFFGAAWALLQPLLMMAIFSVFVGRFVKVTSDGLPYPLFVYAGLVPWTLFSQALTASSNSLLDSRHIITKIYFPRVIAPLAAAGSHIVDFALASIVLAGMMIYYGVPFSASVLLWPLMPVLTVIAALGPGIWLSALSVRYRDVKFAIPFLVQIWLFASPVIYPSSVVPEAWRPLYSLNPMVGVVDGFRSFLLGTDITWNGTVAVSFGAALLFLLTGLLYFRRVERNLADLI